MSLFWVNIQSQTMEICTRKDVWIRVFGIVANSNIRWKQRQSVIDMLINDMARWGESPGDIISINAEHCIKWDAVEVSQSWYRNHKKTFYRICMFPDISIKFRPRLICIFLNENVRWSLKISLKLVLRVRFNNMPSLDQIMPWRWLGGNPLSEPMMVILSTHIYISRPQWVNDQLMISSGVMVINPRFLIYGS